MILSWLASAWLAFAQTHPRVVVGVREPVVNVSPFAALSIEGYRLTSLVYEPLARLNPRTGELEPWLATTWRKTKTGFAVDLRAGVPTHEGRWLTAADLVATFRAFRDPASKAASWLPLWQKVDDVRATGPLTLAFFGQHLGYDDAVLVLTTLRAQPATGPFAFGARGEGRVELNARPMWWHGPAPAFDLLFKPVADETLARQLVTKRQLDFYDDVDGEGTRVSGTSGLWLDLNLRRPPFADPAVRRAVLWSWDRAGLNRRIFGGRARPAPDVFDSHRPGYPAAKAEPFAPERAFKELARAGYVRAGGRWVKDGRPLEFELLVTSARDERWVGPLQGDLARSGITARITRTRADAALFARLREGQFDAVAGGGGLNLTVDAAAWATGGTYNIAGFVDARVDRDLERLRGEWRPARRRSLTRALITRIRAAHAQLPGLVRDGQTVLTSPRLAISVEAPYDVWRWRLED